MKKLLFGLIAIVMFGWGANAQDVANKKNPYDSVGIQHNEVVREFLKKHGSENLSLEKTIELTTAICKSRGIAGPFMTVEQFNFGKNDIKNNFKETVNKSSLSVNGKNELQKLFDFMLDRGFKGDITIVECVDYILAFENQILNNKSLTATDVVFLLKTASVGRHSVSLWNVHFGKEISNATLQNKKMPGWLKWCIVGVCDAAGGLAGAGAFSVPAAISSSTGALVLIKEIDSK